MTIENRILKEYQRLIADKLGGVIGLGLIVAGYIKAGEEKIDSPSIDFDALHKVAKGVMVGPKFENFPLKSLAVLSAYMIGMDTTEVSLKGLIPDSGEVAETARGLLSQIWDSDKYKVSKENEIVKTMRGPDYEPPFDNLFELFIHLLLMESLYEEDGSSPATTEDLWLNLSCAKLLIKAENFIVDLRNKFNREGIRAIKSTITKQTNAFERKNIVLAIYDHGERIAPGISFGGVCKILKKQFEQSRGIKNRPWGKIPQDMKFPSRDTVKDWFDQEGILIRDFDKRGIRWIKQM